MKVLILAAGYGTRLYPIVKNTPKPLLDIAGKTLIDHLVDKIKASEDLKEIIVVTNDKFYGMFSLWAKKNSESRVPIKIINDGTTSPEDRLGSVGDIKFVLENYPVNDDLLVLGGDNLFDYSLDGYMAFAKKNRAVTIGLYDIKSLKDATRFGVVEIDREGVVKTFQEKPVKPRSSLIAMCSYYFPKESLLLIDEYMARTNHTDKAGDYIQWLVEKTPVFGFEFKGTWYDIGSIESLKEAREKFKS